MLSDAPGSPPVRKAEQLPWVKFEYLSILQVLLWVDVTYLYVSNYYLKNSTMDMDVDIDIRYRSRCRHLAQG